MDSGSCGGGNFFALPHWYDYLSCSGGEVSLPKNSSGGVDLLAAAPPIGLALLDILLRIAGIAAIIFVIYGAVSYVLSQGEPDRVNKARGTIINSLVGMAIAIVSVAVVNYIGSKLGGGS